jgi:putative membrane protein
MSGGSPVSEGLAPLYPWIKALHVIAVIAWMAGMLYLPRLFYYHCDTVPGALDSERFKVMERRLIRIIINPAMIAVWALGITLALMSGAYMQGWLMAKFALVVILSGVHGLFSRWRKDFARDSNRRSKHFYAAWNEVPAVLMIGIVILAVVKPF